MTGLLQPPPGATAGSEALAHDTGCSDAMPALSSCLYRGWVRHRRYRPCPHAFRYRLFLVYLDLDELQSVFAGRWLWSTRRWAPARFRREDYLAPHDVPLKEAVLDLVEKRMGHRPDGAVRMLTHLRYWGYCFNPVTFYYCFDASGGIDTIVAEVTNTPWKQRHAYVLPADRRANRARPHRFRFRKQFHVSPFLDMEQDYDWSFSAPGEDLVVHMENHRHGERMLDATLVLQRREITGAGLARSLLVHPFMTAKVALGIHWNALRLWLKRVPFHTHPDKRDPRAGDRP